MASPRPVVVLILTLGLSCCLLAQLSKPKILSPVGPAEKYPKFAWTEVLGATQYNIEQHTVDDQSSCGSGTTVQRPTVVKATIDANLRCSNGQCSFVLFQQGALEGVHNGLGYIHTARDCKKNELRVFTWSVQAVKAGVAGQLCRRSSENVGFWT